MLSSIAYTWSVRRSILALEFSGVKGLVSGGLLTLKGGGDADKNAVVCWFATAAGSVHFMPKYR